MFYAYYMKANQMFDWCIHEDRDEAARILLRRNPKARTITTNIAYEVKPSALQEKVQNAVLLPSGEVWASSARDIRWHNRRD